jgi:hypothetical protein
MTDDKPKLKLVGADGNAFMVLGLAKRAARKAEWTQERIDQFMKEATAGNYDHLLQVTMEHFDVE